MKCVSCQFVCSDLRDICPKCLEDLRPFKKTQGIIITHPLASYEELLEKASKVNTVSKALSSNSAPTGMLKRFFGVAKPAQPIISNEKPMQDTFKPKIDEIIKTEIIEIDASTEELEALKEEIFTDTTKNNPTQNIDPVLHSVSQEPYPAPGNSDLNFQTLHLDFETLDEDLTTQPELEQQDVSSSDIEYSEAELHCDSEIHSDLNVIEVLSEKPNISNYEEENSIFDECYIALENDASNTDFEITYDQFSSKRDNEEVAVLFNLALISLENPEATATLQASVLTSDLRQISAEELSEALKATEAAIDTPILSLKAQKVFEAQRIRGALAQDKNSSLTKLYSTGKKLLPAAPSLRALSFIIDVIFSIACSLGLAFILSSFAFPELQSSAQNFSIQNLKNLNFYGALPFLSLAIVTLVVFFFTYMTLSVYWHGKTLGTSLFGITITRSDFKRVGFSNAFVRALVLPISALCCGYAPALLGKQSIHDHLARTRVSR